MRRAGRARGGEQGDRLRRRALGPIGVGDAMPAARRAHMFAQELPARRIEEPHVQRRSTARALATDPAGRRAVVGRFDFDAAVEVDGARRR